MSARHLHLQDAASVKNAKPEVGTVYFIVGRMMPFMMMRWVKMKMNIVGMLIKTSAAIWRWPWPFSIASTLNWNTHTASVHLPALKRDRFQGEGQPARTQAAVRRQFCGGRFDFVERGEVRFEGGIDASQRSVFGQQPRAEIRWVHESQAGQPHPLGNEGTPGRVG